jgi:hypothetical protein
VNAAATGPARCSRCFSGRLRKTGIGARHHRCSSEASSPENGRQPSDLRNRASHNSFSPWPIPPVHPDVGNRPTKPTLRRPERGAARDRPLRRGGRPRATRRRLRDLRRVRADAVAQGALARPATWSRPTPQQVEGDGPLTTRTPLTRARPALGGDRGRPLIAPGRQAAPSTPNRPGWPTRPGHRLRGARPPLRTPPTSPHPPGTGRCGRRARTPPPPRRHSHDCGFPKQSATPAPPDHPAPHDAGTGRRGRAGPGGRFGTDTVEEELAYGLEQLAYPPPPCASGSRKPSNCSAWPTCATSVNRPLASPMPKRHTSVRALTKDPGTRPVPGLDVCGHRQVDHAHDPPDGCDHLLPGDPLAVTFRLGRPRIISHDIPAISPVHPRHRAWTVGATGLNSGLLTG